MGAGAATGSILPTNVGSGRGCRVRFRLRRLRAITRDSGDSSLLFLLQKPSVAPFPTYDIRKTVAPDVLSPGNAGTRAHVHGVGPPAFALKGRLASQERDGCAITHRGPR